MEDYVRHTVPSVKQLFILGKNSMCTRTRGESDSLNAVVHENVSVYMNEYVKRNFKNHASMDELKRINFRF